MYVAVGPLGARGTPPRRVEVLPAAAHVGDVLALDPLHSTVVGPRSDGHQ